MILFFLIICILETDISFVRVNNFTESKRDPASWIFQNYNIIKSIPDFISLIPKISQTKWVFMSSESTAIAPRYVSHILNSIPDEKAKKLLLGRFGCIPTNYVYGNVHEFKLCYRFPILESGFAFTSDLLKNKQFEQIIKEIEKEMHDMKVNKSISFDYDLDSNQDSDNDSTNYKLSSLKLEYLIGLGTYHANVIDDFRFSYFASNSSFRNSLFLASFNPSVSSNLDITFLHASGIRFKEKVSPFADGEIILGTGLSFNGEIFPFDEHVTISCLSRNISLSYSQFKKRQHKGKIDNDDLLICYPPYHYSDNFNVQIACF